jgi:predicted  nucleic acid-binding Zn-ribbon protein
MASTDRTAAVEIITITCDRCGETWQQVAPQVYTCCLDCWRVLYDAKDPASDPCRCDVQPDPAPLRAEDTP